MRSRVQRLAPLAALLAALSLGGCAGTVSRGPQATLNRYLGAIEARDYASAYAELSQVAQANLAYAEFAALAEANRDDVTRTFGAQRQQTTENPNASETAAMPPVQSEEHALGQSARGLTILLAHTPEEGWSIEQGILGAAIMRTPKDALLALRQALEARNWPGLLRSLSRDERAESEADTQRLIRALGDLESLPLDASGDEIVVELPEASRVRLVREEGEWRVREMD